MAGSMCDVESALTCGTRSFGLCVRLGDLSLMVETLMHVWYGE